MSLNNQFNRGREEKEEDEESKKIIELNCNFPPISELYIETIKDIYKEKIDEK